MGFFVWFCFGFVFWCAFSEFCFLFVCLFGFILFLKKNVQPIQFSGGHDSHSENYQYSALCMHLENII